MIKVRGRTRLIGGQTAISSDQFKVPQGCKLCCRLLHLGTISYAECHPHIYVYCTEEVYYPLKMIWPRILKGLTDQSFDGLFACLIACLINRWTKPHKRLETNVIFNQTTQCANFHGIYLCRAWRRENSSKICTLSRDVSLGREGGETFVCNLLCGFDLLLERRQSFFSFLFFSLFSSSLFWLMDRFLDRWTSKWTLPTFSLLKFLFCLLLLIFVCGWYR